MDVAGERTQRFRLLRRLSAPWQMFLLAFCMYALCVLPVLIMHKGLFFYYGDYNVQQVPFYILAHRAFRDGQFFWTFHLDLGGSVVGDLAFYLTGSPFFWLTLPFPERVVPYLMPFLMALKYATACALAYCYIRRYTKKDASARIGALLYAFSGFNACNIVFNHFTDAVCFFPLFLMTFENLMAIDKDNPERGFADGFRGWRAFALTTLVAVVNYFFFFGMVVFLLLYAALRYVRPKNFPVLPKMFLRALSAGCAGVMLAAFYLNLALAGVAGNARLDRLLTGYDLLVYQSAKMYFDILKNFVMTPDIIGRGTIFYTTTVKNASLAGYLPMYGLAGVVCYLTMVREKKDWKKRVFVASVVCALIPGLNAAFSLLNTQYYARWYYMPVLIMSLMTALAVEKGGRSELKRGALTQAGLFLFMVLVAFLPSTNDEGEVVFFQMSDNPEYFILDAIVTAVLTALFVSVVLLIRRRKTRIKTLFILTVISCVALTMNVIAKGKTLISMYGMEMWKLQMLDTRPELPADGPFYRIETDDSSTNYEMVWGYPTIHCFLSTVPAEIFQFYDGAAGITRWVESELPIARVGVRTLLSARYYVWNDDINTDGEFGKGEGVYGYDETVFANNGLTVFENKNYIPPGFTFGYYIRESDFDEVNKQNNDKLLLKALILPDEAVSRFGSLLEELPKNEISRYISDSAFDALCAERRDSACVAFEPTKSGFYAVTGDLEKDSLVFFSVPAADGFTIYVDGEEAAWTKADYGLMAVYAPKGVHTIEAVYRPRRLMAGALLSFAAVCLIVLYGWICHYTAKRKKEEKPMGAMTMSQKILAAHAGLDYVEAGQLIEADLDLVLGNDITSPVAIKEMDKFDKKGVFDREKIALVLDHFVPAKDIKSAENCKCVRDFAAEHDVTNFFDVGEMGVEHALIPERGLALPGNLIIGADSHTCTYGALGAFSTGVGSTDMACGMATGRSWFKVPAALKFTLTGKPQKYVCGKDVILHIIGMIGVDGALYKSMEFTGDGVQYLNIDDRMTIANMAIEAGGKNGIFPVDDVTRAYLEEHAQGKTYEVFEADADAHYDAEYTIDLSALKPTVSFPHLPENAKTFDEIGEIKIDQVVIGSCTNGHISDMRTAAEIMKGKKVADGVRAIVIPATQKIYLEALEEGLIKTFIEAGCVVSTPTCGPCLGGYMGILASGERCVSTTNRNFVGRMGAIDSEIYLASPAVAASSAIAGYLASPA